MKIVITIYFAIMVVKRYTLLFPKEMLGFFRDSISSFLIFEDNCLGKLESLCKFGVKGLFGNKLLVRILG